MVSEFISRDFRMSDGTVPPTHSLASNGGNRVHVQTRLPSCGYWSIGLWNTSANCADSQLWEGIEFDPLSRLVSPNH